MLLKIDFESETPIYIQLRNQIIEAIAGGNILPGESLPSVRQLAEDIGINLHTVNKVYTILKNDGFVRADRRKGTIINVEGNNVTTSYMELLKEQLNSIVAEAFCRKMKKGDFLELCENIYNKYRKDD